MIYIYIYTLNIYVFFYIIIFLLVDNKISKYMKEISSDFLIIHVARFIRKEKSTIMRDADNIKG